MKTTTSTAALVLLASATTTLATPLYRRQSPPLDHCASASDPNLCTSTVNAIVGWDASVNGVNFFLNYAGTAQQPSLATTQGLIDAEPGFLTTLQAVPGLSQTGQDAASFLGANFGTQVKDEFDHLVAGNVGVHDAVNEINNARCNGILENIGTLWIEAAAASGADVPGRPLGPFVCELEPANVGDAYTADS